MTAPLKIYAVALSFQNGVGGMSMIPAHTEAMAVGYAVITAMRSLPAPEGDLTHVMAREVDPGFLRSLIQAAETGVPGADRVVQLVQPEAKQWPPVGSPEEALGTVPLPGEGPPQITNEEAAAWRAGDHSRGIWSPPTVGPDPHPLHKSACLIRWGGSCDCGMVGEGPPAA